MAFETALALTKDDTFQNRAMEYVNQHMSVEVGVERYKEIYENL